MGRKGQISEEVSQVVREVTAARALNGASVG
jgi:hypothetical protein